MNSSLPHDDITYHPNEGSIIMTSTVKSSPTASVNQFLSVYNVPNSTYWKIDIPYQ